MFVSIYQNTRRQIQKIPLITYTASNLNIKMTFWPEMATQFSYCLSRTGYLLELQRGATTVFRSGAQGNAATEGVSRREAAAASVRRFGGQFFHNNLKEF
jgi:hypothetical protein